MTISRFCSAIENCFLVSHDAKRHPLGPGNRGLVLAIDNADPDTVLSDSEQAIAMIAPIASPVGLATSLVFAGISRYLFKKAASYKNEITALEKDIDHDAAIIKALEALKK